MNRSQRLRRKEPVDAYEDAVEVYFDPIDEEGSVDCECVFAFTTTKDGGEPVARCIHCGRLAK